MDRRLVEYKDAVGIVTSNYPIKRISFVATYVTPDERLAKQEFQNENELFSYKTECKFRQDLVKLQVSKYGDPQYRFIDFDEKSRDKEIKIQRILKITVNPITRDEISFREEDNYRPANHSNMIVHLPGGQNSSHWRTRRCDLSNETPFTSSPLSDDYLQLIPSSAAGDLSLELLFFAYVLNQHKTIKSTNQLEARLLQYKGRIEGVKSGIAISDTGEAEGPRTSLDHLIGLNKVKSDIEELKSLAKSRKHRQESNLPVSPSTLHLVFTGNPGTGKTTVAREIGRIYHQLGLLSTDKVVEVSRQDLIGEYVGHTAPKTTKVFNSALGGVLFIDEAYSLNKKVKDFGNEAIETLLKLMEDNRDKLVVIVAGYIDEMNDFLASNPGLKSRFSKYIHFDNFDYGELIQIFKRMCAEGKYELAKGAELKLEIKVEEAYNNGGFTSNARDVRNLFERCLQKQASRIDKSGLTEKEDIVKILDNDIPNKI